MAAEYVKRCARCGSTERDGRNHCVPCFRISASQAKRARAPSPLDGRFWEKVDTNGPVPAHRPELGPCWLWTGGLNEDGYGRLQAHGGPKLGKRLAHRVAFFLQWGRWPEPCALHKCDNPACVRWDHLFEGTVADNNADRDRKGRHVGSPGLRNGRHTCPESTPQGERNGHSKLTDEQAQIIRDSPGPSRALAARFGVSRVTIWEIRTGRSRKAS